MKPTLEDLIAGIPARHGNGGSPRVPGVSATRSRETEPVTQIDKTTANARRVLDEEARVRAEKTALLKAAREARDRSGET